MVAPDSGRCPLQQYSVCLGPRRGQVVFLADLAFAALRAARYFLILAFGTSLCLAHTIPNTGAAGFLQPGTGQSCLGAFRRGLSRPTAIERSGFFGGRPGPR